MSVELFFAVLRARRSEMQSDIEETVQSSLTEVAAGFRSICESSMVRAQEGRAAVLALLKAAGAEE